MFNIHVILLLFYISECLSRDFYSGIFRKNDYLVAQDRLYKERIPYRRNVAKYGRLFKCPITYFRIADRLNVGRAPEVRIIRGGLLKKYIVFLIVSAYNLPLSVNIYVGCENKEPKRLHATASDFYGGMFSKNDYLVAQDRLYKERIPYRKIVATYGRLFKCPITYFRIADRLKVGRAPEVRIIRGGLLKKYIVFRIVSAYNLPLSVNIYVGCENKEPKRLHATAANKTEDVTTVSDGNASETGASDHRNGAGTGAMTVQGGGDATTVASSPPCTRYILVTM